MIITDLVTYLQTEGVGTVGTTLFASYLPDTINTGACVIDTGGVTPDVDLPSRDKTFQVFIRGNTYAVGQALVDSVRNALHQVTNTQIGDYYFYYILANGDGGHIGKNDRGLDEFSINFTALLR